MKCMSRLPTTAALLAATLALCLPAVLDAQDQALTVATYLDYETVGDPQIAPDGSRIVYTRRWVNKIEDRFESALWMMNADGSQNRFLVEGSGARWSPDGGRILYTATGEPTGSQIFVRWMDAEGATSQITRVEESPRNPAWSPDGRSISFAMLVPDPIHWSIPMPTAPEGAHWTAAPRIVDDLHYRQDRVGFQERGWMHLFLVTADGGTPRQLTSGQWNVGARFDGLVGDAGYDWTPDGATIVFDGWQESSGDEQYRASNIYAVPAAGGAVRRVTARPGNWTSPAVSPDGQSVAYVGYDSAGNTYSMGRLYVIPLAGGEPRLVSGDLDRDPSNPVWGADGAGIYFGAQDQGSVNVFYAATRGGVRRITEGAQVLSLSSMAQDRDLTAVGVRTDARRPGDVIRLSLRRPAAVTQLTHVNDDILANRSLGAVEELWFNSADGTRVHGWLVKPPNFDPSARYPLIMEIHGGPFAMYNVAFNMQYQIFAAAGNLVLYTNPRGSTGYGETFSRGIDFRYPGVDYEDLIAGVNATIATGNVDTTRMYVGGCSGGGVLSSWVIGHTDRFAAAAVRCPVINWLSFLGQSDIPFFTQSFFREPFWVNPQRWLEQSSLMYVGNVTTPTLLMTGELDLRTPMPQTEEYFAALKIRGIPTRMLRFNNEYHGTSSRPSNFMRTALYMLDWYGRYRREPGGTVMSR